MISTCDRLVRAALGPVPENWYLLAVGVLLLVESSTTRFFIPRTSGRSVARDVDIMRKEPSAACVMERYTRGSILS